MAVPSPLNFTPSPSTAPAICASACSFNPAGATRVGSARSAIHELMWIANEAYHTNFAASLASASEDTAYGVETRQSQAFDELFETTEAVAARVRAFQPINWPRHPAFTDPDKLRQFVTPSRAQEEKEAYLDAMSRFLSGEPSMDEKAHDEARHRYIRFIAEHFGQKWENNGTKFALSPYLFGAGAVAGELLTDVPGLVTGGLLVAAEQFLSPMLIKKLAIRDLQNALDNRELIEGDIDLKERLRRRSVLASITLDRSKAVELVRDVPRFGG